MAAALLIDKDGHVEQIVIDGTPLIWRKVICDNAMPLNQESVASYRYRDFQLEGKCLVYREK
jgi:hypothetical protein